jgi:hypothetical protein
MSSYALSLAGATFLGWTAVVLAYEIPCALGKYTELDVPIVRTALRAEAVVTMKHRTSSLAVNKIIHELEEIKFFYSQI